MERTLTDSVRAAGGADVDRYRVRRVTDGMYLHARIYSDDSSSLEWRKSSDMAHVWTREQAQRMARAVDLIWGGWMSLELEPAKEGGGANG